MKNKIKKLFKQTEIELLRSLIGKNLEKIRHDTFIFTNVSYKRITLFVDTQVYQLLNEVEELDFMWDDFGKEAVAVFSFKEIEDFGIDYNYGIPNYPKQTETKIDETIKDIIIIEDNIKSYDKSSNKLISEYSYVKGIILVLNGIKFCFDRSVWFSEDITINKGENPESKIGDINNDWEWGESRYSKNTRVFNHLNAVS